MGAPCLKEYGYTGFGAYVKAIATGMPNKNFSQVELIH
jgi:hypothetical protein